MGVVFIVPTMAATATRASVVMAVRMSVPLAAIRAMKVGAPTGNTLFRALGAGKRQPAMPAAGAQERSISAHIYMSSFNSERTGGNQRPGGLGTRRVQNPAECLARNVHFFGGDMVVEALQIGKPDSLQFIELKDDLHLSADPAP